jgi:hypothetical protein
MLTRHVDRPFVSVGFNQDGPLEVGPKDFVEFVAMGHEGRAVAWSLSHGSSLLAPKP